MLTYDLVVIGGGIHGTAVARDAAGRGYRVLLCEQHDLAGGTSSASTKLIHGGLRYLEQGEFRLVREALAEREMLLKNAPHLVHPQTFILPQTGLRPAWMIRLGLFLYDHLSKRTRLAASQSINLQKHVFGEALNPLAKRAFTYADCVTNDARLVIENAISAKQFGATILTRTACAAINPSTSGYQISLQNQNKTTQTILTRAIINTCGPWQADFFSKLPALTPPNYHLVQGSHLIVPKQFHHTGAYLFQLQDRRVIFAIPYQQHFTLIGTTDYERSHFNGDTHITETEIAYLLENINVFLKHPLAEKDIMAHFSGVRVLTDTQRECAQHYSRDYHLDVQCLINNCPIISIIGGKLTTHRRAAENIVDTLSSYLPTPKKAWTHNATLPGAQFDVEDFEQFKQNFETRYAFLPNTLRVRLITTYGQLALSFLGDCQTLDALGKCIGGDLFEREIAYLVEQEWAKTAEDILWRRTQLGLVLHATQQEELARYLAHFIGKAF